jgi:hypothetical protein
MSTHRKVYELREREKLKIGVRLRDKVLF